MPDEKAAPVRPPVIQYMADSWYCVWKDLKMEEAGGMADLPISAGHRVCQYFGDGPGSVGVEGSLDGIHWYKLTDNKGAALQGMVISAGELHDICQITRYIRPVISGGSALTNVTFAVMAG